MRLGVLSDTHGHTGNTLAAVRVLQGLGVDQLIHCGDVGSLAVVPILSGWPTHFVAGNVDRPAELGAAVAASGLTFHDRFGELEIAGCRIAFLHGDDTLRLQATVADGRWQLVCHGHTHVASLHRVGDVQVLNPGALYRAARHTVAVIDVPELRIEHVTVG